MCPHPTPPGRRPRVKTNRQDRQNDTDQTAFEPILLQYRLANLFVGTASRATNNVRNLNVRRKFSFPLLHTNVIDSKIYSKICYAKNITYRFCRAQSTDSDKLNSPRDSVSFSWFMRFSKYFACYTETTFKARVVWETRYATLCVTRYFL